LLQQMMDIALPIYIEKNLDHRPDMQLAGILARCSCTLLTVHDVSEVEQLGGCLPVERLRGRGLRLWGCWLWG